MLGTRPAHDKFNLDERLKRISERQQGWSCDLCGKLIRRAEEGWVEWVSPQQTEWLKGRGGDLRLVHRGLTRRRDVVAPETPNGCQGALQRKAEKVGGAVEGLPLANCTGAEGLTRLLALLSSDILPVTSVLDLIQRLNVPGYEQARPHFARAAADGLLEAPAFGQEGCYSQHQIRMVIESYCPEPNPDRRASNS